MKERKSSNILTYFLLVLYAIFTLVPMLWVFSTSLKPSSEAMSFPPSIIPKTISLENYRFVIQDPFLMRALGNSFLVVIPSTILCVAVSALAGFAFARYEFKGKNLILGLMMAIFMIPVVMNTIPLYVMFNKLNLLDNFVALILSYQILIIPLNIFLLKSHFETIPVELEEAAMIDGCNRVKALWKVTLPCAWPALAVSGIFSFRFSWNELIFPLTFANMPEMNVFQVALYKFMGLYQVDWGALTACIIIGMIPILLMFLFFQKQMVAGFTAGAIKG
jgi:ABC-type glycerol-3-phosphate transport system permease component